MTSLPRCARLLSALVLLTAGCASSGGGAAPPSSTDLTSTELEELGTVSLHDAIQTLRPRWLRNRAPEQDLVVVLDGIRQGGVRVLLNIPVSTVHRVRFLSASDATTLYGTGVWGGVIEVETRR